LPPAAGWIADKASGGATDGAVMRYSRVTLLPSQQVLIVEEGETILDAALRAGLNLPHSCKGGHCSSCRAHLRTGRISYRHGRPLGLMEEEEREGLALLCQAYAESEEITVEVREIRPPVPEIVVKSLPARIERLQPLAPDVLAVFLRLPANEPFHFVPGQYIDIMLPQNRRRSFSIASTPESPLLELHVRRVAGGELTQQLFYGMSEKTLLRIEGPLGQFWFRRESPRPALLIGGGTGYAPLRSMLKSLIEVGDRRPLHLYWGAQTRADLYEDEAIRELCRHFPNLSYTPVLSAPRDEDNWQGRIGWVHAAALSDHPNLEAFDVYASGPPAMVEAVRHEFIERGLPAGQLFFDSFDYAPDALAKLTGSASP
jgi:CDP-4-dehydro-6-deoxyglucose reductase